MNPESRANRREMRLQSETVLSQHEESGVVETLEPLAPLRRLHFDGDRRFYQSFSRNRGKVRLWEPLNYEKSSELRVRFSATMSMKH
jgi:hypothetical protein